MRFSLVTVFVEDPTTLRDWYTDTLGLTVSSETPRFVQLADDSGQPCVAFHVGRPIEVLVEWQDLGARLARPGVHYAVMPPDSAAECARFLPGVYTEPVLRNTDLSGGRHEHPLVLLRGMLLAPVSPCPNRSSCRPSPPPP